MHDFEVQGRHIRSYLMVVSLLLIYFFYLFIFFAMIGRQVIIEQVNHTSSCSRERERERERGGRERENRGGWVEREIFVSA